MREIDDKSFTTGEKLNKKEIARQFLAEHRGTSLHQRFKKFPERKLPSPKFLSKPS